VPVERRTIVVSASASGAIEPPLTVDVKSKASGEIIGMNVQTGDDVKEDELLATIDPRIPRNNLAQAQANLQVAQAQLATRRRSWRGRIRCQGAGDTQTEYDQSKLDYANANAAVIRAQSDLENARDRMTNEGARALGGTIITKSVELGTVISSPRPTSAAVRSCSAWPTWTPCRFAPSSMSRYRQSAAGLAATIPWMRIRIGIRWHVLKIGRRRRSSRTSRCSTC